MKLVEKMVMLRKAKGLTQLQVAEKINVSRQAISKWESGSAVPSINNLKYLAALYGVSVDYLLKDDIEWIGQHEDVARNTNESVDDGAEINEDVVENPIRQQRERKKTRRLIIVVCFIIVIAVAGLLIYGQAVAGPKRLTFEEMESDSLEMGDSEHFSIIW